MAEPTESARAAGELWALLAQLTPRLHADAAVERQYYRGEPWFVVTDSAGGEAYRLAAATAPLFDTRPDAGNLAARAHRTHPQASPELLEQVALAAVRLYRAGLLEFDPYERVPASIRELRKAGKNRRPFNPLALRLPLFDPDPLLDRMQPLARVLFSWPVALAVLLLLSVCAPLAFMAWPVLGADLLSQLDTNSSWLTFGLCYVALKVFHECAHALAVKRWGGRVHDVGLMLLVFFPVPYVDASASNRFTDKYRRIIVAGAGVIAELVAAALALLLWLHSEPGFVHTMAFNVVVVGGLSTLLFNGNPLMRFDAYYVLSDLLEIPNLYTRSRAYLNYLVLRYAFATRHVPSPATSGSEARWLLVYGLASVVYRAGILLAIALYLADSLFFIGLGLACWVVVSEFGRPLVRLVGELRRLDSSAPLRCGRLVRAGMAVTLVAAFITLVPLPQATLALGVVTIDEDAQVRAGAGGFIERIDATPGAALDAGQRVLQLGNDELRRNLAVAEARLTEHRARYTAASAVDRVAARVLEQSVHASERHRDAIARQVQALSVASPAAGVFIAPALEAREGTYVERGENLGLIAAPAHLIVRVVVPETRLDQFAQPLGSIALRFVDAPDRVVPARAAGVRPASLEQLPSAALGSAFGGPVATDPADPQGLKTLENTYQIDLKPLEFSPATRVSGLAYARFEHPPEALLPRFLRAAKRLFLAKFSV